MSLAPPSVPAAPSAAVPDPHERRRNLSDVDRRTAYEMLLEAAANGVLPRGTFVNTAHHFGCHADTISRIWSRARESLAAGAAIADTAARIKGNCGAKRKRSPSEIEAAIKAVPQQDRQTMRSLETHSKIPKTTIINHMKEKKTLKARSSHVKPLLTQENLTTRLKYAWSFLRPAACGNYIFLTFTTMCMWTKSGSS
ncbi:Aste57867_17890 [Aphanomyces stellatus]|uniref:Aste57867_17890 protein n=1 Tax=Aphanomyces stellatus TaxID=120398 RepID=A0A485LCB7_9STRA|nr:hypothetical protein As57867_017829 [Aphanomyces stellatus]VFT94632.1 Aste57867_17890 [Aphanomyces stellatus]